MRVSPAFACILLLVFSCGCSLRSKPASYSRIIMEGDENPTIREEPTRAGEITRISNQPRRQPQQTPEPQ